MCKTFISCKETLDFSMSTSSNGQYITVRMYKEKQTDFKEYSRDLGKFACLQS